MRTREGLTASGARGRIGSKPTALSTELKAEVRCMRDGEKRDLLEIAGLFKVSISTIRRA